jgi:ADP-ribose pyrophosphatase YjhB (NUDIX family)
MFDSLPGSRASERWQRQYHPMPVVVAIIGQELFDETNGSAQDSFLLIRRNREPYNQAWALVGGKWDFGETLAQAVEREVREETSLKTKFTSLQGIVSERMAYTEAAEGKSAHFLLFVCRLESIEGQAVEQSEGGVAWFTNQEIERLQSVGTIIPSDYLMLKQFSDSHVLAYHEADMVSGEADHISALVRFEQID